MVGIDPSQLLSRACPRLELNASSLSLGVVAGRVDVTSTAMSLLAHAAGPGRGPGKQWLGRAHVRHVLAPQVAPRQRLPNIMPRKAAFRCTD